MSDTVPVLVLYLYRYRNLTVAIQYVPVWYKYNAVNSIQVGYKPYGKYSVRYEYRYILVQYIATPILVYTYGVLHPLLVWTMYLVQYSV